MHSPLEREYADGDSYLQGVKKSKRMMEKDTDGNSKYELVANSTEVFVKPYMWDMGYHYWELAYETIAAIQSKEVGVNEFVTKLKAIYEKNGVTEESIKAKNAVIRDKGGKSFWRDYIRTFRNPKYQKAKSANPPKKERSKYHDVPHYFRALDETRMSKYVMIQWSSYFKKIFDGNHFDLEPVVRCFNHIWGEKILLRTDTYRLYCPLLLNTSKSGPFQITKKATNLRMTYSMFPSNLRRYLTDLINVSIKLMSLGKNETTLLSKWQETGTKSDTNAYMRYSLRMGYFSGKANLQAEAVKKEAKRRFEERKDRLDANNKDFEKRMIANGPKMIEAYQQLENGTKDFASVIQETNQQMDGVNPDKWEGAVKTIPMTSENERKLNDDFNGYNEIDFGVGINDTDHLYISTSDTKNGDNNKIGIEDGYHNLALKNPVRVAKPATTAKVVKPATTMKVPTQVAPRMFTSPPDKRRQSGGEGDQGSRKRHFNLDDTTDILNSVERITDSMSNLIPDFTPKSPSSNLDDPAPPKRSKELTELIGKKLLTQLKTLDDNRPQTQNPLSKFHPSKISKISKISKTRKFVQGPGVQYLDLGASKPGVGPNLFGKPNPGIEKRDEKEAREAEEAIAAKTAKVTQQAEAKKAAGDAKSSKQ